MDKYLVSQAHDNGWILYSLDWGGFSLYDLPTAARLLLYDAQDTLEQIYASVAQVATILSVTIYYVLLDSLA